MCSSRSHGQVSAAAGGRAHTHTGGEGEEGLLKELTVGVLGGFPRGARESLMHSLRSWAGSVCV